MALGDWWRDQHYPTVDRLTVDQATAVLDWIIQAEWDCRPF